MKKYLIAVMALCCAIAGSAGALEISLPGETATFKPSTLPGYTLVQQRCPICHSAEYVNFQPPTSTPAYWKATVLKMRKPFGAPLSDEDAELITEYLVKTYSNAEKIKGGSKN